MHYDTHGSLTLSGIKHYDALGETPPDTSGKDKDRFRKSYYYFYTLATMEPVFRKSAGIATSVGVAGIVGSLVTGGLSLIASGAAGIAGLAAAANTENCVMETTAWWYKSPAARDAFIARAMVGDDIKQLLRKAARKMDSVAANAKSKQAKTAARARAYFLDFIAIGPQKNLRQLNEAQQAAYGAAYLDALGQKKSIPACLIAGSNAAAAKGSAQVRHAQTMAKVASARAAAKSKRDVAIAAAKAKAKAEIELKAQQAKLPPGGLATAPPGLRLAIGQAQAQVQVQTAGAQRADAAALAAEKEASAVVAQQEVLVEGARLAPPESSEQSSAEDAAIESANPQAAAAETAAVAAGASPDSAAAAGAAVAAGASPEAATAAAVVQTASNAGAGGEENKGGFPIIPALAVAGIAAFLLMRKK